MKSRKEPQLLSHVLQALTDFKAGTTLKKITDRVQTAVNLSKVRPRPRNLAGQVRRALRHGVQTGVFKHRSGRFRLATTNEINQALKLGYVSAKRRRGKRAPRKKRKRSPSRRASMRLSPRERARLRRFVNSKRHLRQEDYSDEGLVPEPSDYSNIADRQHMVPEMDASTHGYYTLCAKHKRGRGKRSKRASHQKRRRRRHGAVAAAYELPQHFEEANAPNENFYDDYDVAQNGPYPECDNPECLCNRMKNSNRSQNNADVSDDPDSNNKPYSNNAGYN